MVSQLPRLSASSTISWRVAKTRLLGTSILIVRRPWKVCGTLRVVGERCNAACEIFCSDFAKAFKQVPAVEELLKLSVIVQWDPVLQKPAFMLPQTQTFAKKGLKCRLGAWFGFHDAISSFLSGWHASLAVYVFMGLMKGWLIRKGTSLDAAPIKTKVGEEDFDTESAWVVFVSSDF